MAAKSIDMLKARNTIINIKDNFDKSFKKMRGYSLEFNGLGIDILNTILQGNEFQDKCNKNGIKILRDQMEDFIHDAEYEFELSSICGSFQRGLDIACSDADCTNRCYFSNLHGGGGCLFSWTALKRSLTKHENIINGESKKAAAVIYEFAKAMLKIIEVKNNDKV